MSSQIHGVLDFNKNLLFGGIFVLSVIVGIALKKRKERLTGLPVMTGYGSDHERALMDGTERYPNSPFVVETTPPLVILPMCVLEDFKNAHADRVSFHAEQRKTMVAEYTGVFRHNPQMAEAISSDLNRSLASTLTEVEEEIGWVFAKELGAPQEWTTFPLYAKTVRVVARLTSGVFVGPRMARDDEWTNLLLNLVVSFLRARDAIKRFPSFIQPIAAKLIPELRVLNQHLREMGKMLQPIINDVLLKQPEKNKNELKIDAEAGTEAQEGNFMTWISKRLNTVDADNLARAQLSLSFASVHTTTNALTFVLLDLASRPEYTQPLRDEIEEIIKEDNVELDDHGVLRFKQTSLAKLKKLDSFIKESQRMYKNPVSLLRLAMKDLTLSTGHKVPKGSRMAFNQRAVHTSPMTETYSPAYNPPENKSPHDFDGFRFYNLRNMPGKANKHLAVTVSPESLIFGYGVHACPGRFFAINEMKVIIVELLRNWDFRMPIPSQNSESMRHLLDLFIVPPREAQIELRRRKV